MKHQSNPWDTFLIVAMMLIAGVCAQAQAAVAQNTDASEVEAGAGDIEAEAEAPAPVVEEPAYWIGIRGRSIKSAVLRTHLQLAEDMGVVVEEVLDDSPAAKAGLRKHDILLRVNGDAVDNMQVLQAQVRTSKDKPLELKIIRLGKQEKISLVPEVLPESQRQPTRPLGRLNGRRLEGDVMQQLLEQLGARNIGPMLFNDDGQRFGFNQLPDGQLPNNISVSIHRKDEGPAQITVKQGEKTWQIEENDEEALKQLPDEVRPHIERMLNGQNNRQGFGGAFDLRDLNLRNLEAELEGVLPRGLGNFRPQGDLQRRRLDQQDPLRKRMEQLEKRLQQLQKRLDNEESAVPLDRTT